MLLNNKKLSNRKGLTGILQPKFILVKYDTWITLLLLCSIYATMSRVSSIRELIMNEYTLTEFSIFYKRLMVVENILKTLIVTQYSTVFADRAYSILYRYFHTLDMQRKGKEQVFKNIYNSEKSQEDKLVASVNKMYLGEILNIFSNPVFLKNKKIVKIFFPVYTETNNTEFQKKQKILKDFRNCIAHGNDKKYYIERQKFIKGLVFFEKILKCNPILSCDVINKITIHKKLSVNEILAIIYDIDKSYFKDDKLLILLFDEIALMNGYIFKSLPQRWSIIRQKFDMEKKIKENKPVENRLIQNNQMTLNFKEQF